jgi:hypothetical protein
MLQIQNSKVFRSCSKSRRYAIQVSTLLFGRGVVFVELDVFIWGFLLVASIIQLEGVWEPLL